MTDVSVVIPTKDRGHLLPATLASALAQRGVDLEVIVVDDASSDGTEDWIRGIDDRRVQVIRVPVSRGVSAARNRGIEMASGAWIAFLDDDDLWSPEKLALQLDAAARERAGWAYAGDVIVDRWRRVIAASPPPTPDLVMRRLPHMNPVPTGASNVVVRGDVLSAAGGFDVHLRRTEDWDMWIRLARLGRPSCVSSPLVAYRFHPGSIASDTHAIVDEPEVLATRYGIAIDRAAVRRRAAWVSLRAGRRIEAIRHYAHAARMGDVRSLGRAAVALVHPMVGSEKVFALRPRPRGDERRRAEAQAWLDRLEGSPRFDTGRGS